jgi:hypothetical protein
MKKILFLAIGLLTLAGSVSAQGYYGPRRAVRRPAPRSRADDFYRIKVGITGGVNVANLVNTYNSNFNTGSVTGFNAGLTLDIPLIYPLLFAPEVLYSQKGYTAVTADGNFTQHANYIDVPLLAKIRLAPGFNFVIGPQFSIPTSVTNTYDDGFATIAREHYSTAGDKTLFDGVIGVGIDLNRFVELRARYTIDLNQTDSNGNTYVPDYRNQVWQFGLGIKFQ